MALDGVSQAIRHATTEGAPASGDRLLAGRTREHGWKHSTASLGSTSKTVKSLPARQVTWVQSLGQEDPLERDMATHSSILAWRIPWTEEPGRLQSTGL